MIFLVLMSVSFLLFFPFSVVYLSISVFFCLCSFQIRNIQSSPFHFFHNSDFFEHFLSVLFPESVPSPFILILSRFHHTLDLSVLVFSIIHFLLKLPTLLSLLGLLFLVIHICFSVSDCQCSLINYMFIIFNLFLVFPLRSFGFTVFSFIFFLYPHYFSIR